MLALRQPMAVDLRNILGGEDGDRAGAHADYAKNNAKRSIVLMQGSVPPRHDRIDRIGKLVQGLRPTCSTPSRRATSPLPRCGSDEEIDDAYNGLFRELLTYMMEDPRTITAGTHLMFMAKNIERIGDHVTNIAELIVFRVTGTPFATDRPKGGGQIYQTA